MSVTTANQQIASHFFDNLVAMGTNSNNEVDMINDVPPADISRLKTTPEGNVFMRSGDRLTAATTVSRIVTDTDGKPLFPNPLRDC